MPFEDGAFDCIVAMSILEHIERLNDTLAAVRRVLASNGSFHVVVPANGGIAVNAFKMIMTYPTMRRRNITRPDLVWHTLNVNSFKRVRALLHLHFGTVRETAVPFGFAPWWMSPLWAFECKA